METINDPELARLAAKALSIRPIRLMETLSEPRYQSSIPVLTIGRQSESLPESIALRVYLRFDDAHEIKIGSWVTQGPHGGMHGSGIGWRIDPNDEGKLTFAQETIDRLIELGKADVILRTDAAIAVGYPEIKQVIGFSMIFKDVPIEIAEDLSSIWNSSRGSSIKGQLLEDTTDVPDSEQTP